MSPKPGIYTSEFWLTAVANIGGAVMALLAGYGLIKHEEGELWLALIQALALAIIPLALAYTNGRYIEARSSVKSGAQNQKSTAQSPEFGVWDPTFAEELAEEILGDGSWIDDFEISDLG